MAFAIFEKKCACGEMILGPRMGGKARGEWLGHDECAKCRKDAKQEQSS